MLRPYLLRIRERLRDRALDVTDAVTKRSALVLAPHPDDETLGCGATIMRKLAAGAEVHIVVVADGRHSNPNRYLSPPGLAAMRHDEMIECARRLGLPGSALEQLGYEDLTIAAHERAISDIIADRIERLRPDEVFVTGAFDSDPDHAALGRAARRAVRAVTDPPLLLEYPIWLWTHLWFHLGVTMRSRILTAAAAAPVLLGLKPPVVVRADDYTAGKLSALDAHVSQLRRPEGVPETQPWDGLPDWIMSVAAEPQEMFFPWPVSNSKHFK